MKSLFAITLLFIIAGCSHSTYETYTAENLELDSTYNSTDLESLIAPYRNEVDAQMSEIIGICDSTLIKYAPESPLGNFAADVVFEKGIKLSPPGFSNMGRHNTFALLNFGGLRAPINKGDITIGNVFELMPFDNTITIVHVDAAGVMDLIEYMFIMNGQPISNATFDLTEKDRQMFVNELPVELNRTGVYIITSNYLASGGDKMDFLKNSTQKWDSGVLIRDVFIEHIKSTHTISNTGIDGRLIISK
ncbi:MAG: 2',3'-cyclic-nucleotide 2'-phosphodiesterase (5'-nucleotidase family) [Crocinitomix sp.]